MSILGLKSLYDKLRDRIARLKTEARQCVVVGYTAKYALFVHEDLEATHGEAFNQKHAADIAAGREEARGPNQQAKYLEMPFRKLQNDGTLLEIINKAMASGASLIEAQLLAGLRVQRDSEEIVPVSAPDGGNLKNSAFTRQEELP